MAVTYKKLFKLLIDRDMKKQDLRAVAHLSSSTIAKLTRGENVSTAILLKICTALDCDVSDVMAIKDVSQNKQVPETVSYNRISY